MGGLGGVSAEVTGDDVVLPEGHGALGGEGGVFDFLLREEAKDGWHLGAVTEAGEDFVTVLFEEACGLKEEGEFAHFVVTHIERRAVLDADFDADEGGEFVTLGHRQWFVKSTGAEVTTGFFDKTYPFVRRDPLPMVTESIAVDLHSSAVAVL